MDKYSNLRMDDLTTRILSASVEVFYAPFTNDDLTSTAGQSMVESVQRILAEGLGV